MIDCLCVCVLIRQTHTQISSCSVPNMGPPGHLTPLPVWTSGPLRTHTAGDRTKPTPSFWKHTLTNTCSVANKVLCIRLVGESIVTWRIKLHPWGTHRGASVPTVHVYVCLFVSLQLSHTISKKWLWQEKKMQLISVKLQLHLWAEHVNRHNIDTETRIKRRKVFQLLCSERIKVLLLYYVPFATVCEVRLNKLKWHLSCLLKIP